MTFERKRYRDQRWGGCRGVTNRIIDIVVDIKKPHYGRARRRAYRLWLVSSRKRWASFGNPDSDHHRSQRLADAIDFRLDSDYETRDRVMVRLGYHGGGVGDFGHYIIKHNQALYRVQPIAGTHGTGPHLHFGVRRV